MSDDQLISEMKEKLGMGSGPIDEGKKDNRNSVKTGSVVEWNTYPGVVYVEPESPEKKYKGKVYLHFTGRERRADYKLGAQTGTNDNQTSGRVAATYSFSRDNEVFFTELAKEGGLGRVGDACVRHVQSVNGVDLG